MADLPATRHRPIVPFDYGTLREDAATFYANNKIFEGFKNMDYSKAMTALAGSFQLTFTDKWKIEREDFELKPGVRIHSHIGKEALFEGYVSRFNVNITSGSRNLTISGRDRTADLVDCSHTGPSEFNDLGIKEIAEQMTKPFGIKVLNPDLVNLGAKFDKYTIRQGETVFEALNRAAKLRELILLTSTHGNLVLTKRANKRAGTELVEGVNMTLTGATFDESERFSEYTVKSQQSGILADIDQTTKSKAVSRDKGVNRFRPTVIVADNASDADGAQKRANHENSFKTAKSLIVSVAVVGWRKKDGDLWNINELVPVQVPSIGIRETLLINKVTYKRSENGRSVDLELIRKDAFLFEDEKSADSDPLASLGWG